MAKSAENGVHRFRTALVTGASQRIGAAIASDLARCGFMVVIHYHSSRAKADATAAAITGNGGRAITVKADLTVIDDCRSLVDKARVLAGPVDLLVNNASVFKTDSARKPEMGNWEKHFAIHVKAPCLLAADIARQREIGRGLIVNMIDQRVWALTPNFFSYTLSKSALWAATQTMAQEFAPKIRVNAIGPGPSLPNERQSKADFDAQCKALILKQGPQLHEFGATIRYLYETESITGQMIALDGGQHLAWATPDAIGVKE